MKVIYKYEFPISGIVEIELPFKSKVLSIRIQNGKPYLWAIIESDEESKVIRKFYVFATGFPLPSNISSLNHITTISDGKFVWHIFE